MANCDWVRMVLVAVVVELTAAVAGAAEPRVQVDFGAGFDVAAVETRDVAVDLVEIGGVRHLQVQSGHTARWPGITLRPGRGAGAGAWDLSGFRTVLMDVTNTGKSRLTVGLRVDNPGADGNVKCIQVTQPLAPGQSHTLIADIATTPWVTSRPLEIVGMRGIPGQLRIDPKDVNQILVFAADPKEDGQFVIGNIRLEGEVAQIDAATFFPFIDEFGQFIHDDWPGKIHSLEELAARREAEARYLEAHPEPPGRSKYGGWADGPKLEARGYFHTARSNGKWWLVDPQGQLFWSTGVTGVSPAASWTPVSHREHYFRNLPKQGAGGARDSLAAFYGEASWAPQGWYKDKIPYKTYNFFAANIWRKYGQDGPERFADLAHLRLRSWGLNTIANWSSPEVYRKDRTAYTATAHITSRQIEGSKGYWGKFADVFDPSFAQGLRKALADRKQELGDPWCIGFFVDNELSWGTELSLAQATLASPAGQPAKQAFVGDLRKRYGEIGQLNATWGTSHSSWEALLASTAPADEKKADDDLRTFARRLARTYFRTVRDELRAAGLKSLYLGCRFAGANNIAIQAASEYCDVVSFNKYQRDVRDVRLPEGAADKPIIIGEFHFGALDRGMFHTGLVKARNQAHRAEMYTNYVRSALDNPAIVGVHWFQFASQATTGRGDGENYQIGFVDICDTPYTELVEAATRLGQTLYQGRAGTSAGE